MRGFRVVCSVFGHRLYCVKNNSDVGRVACAGSHLRDIKTVKWHTSKGIMSHMAFGVSPRGIAYKTDSSSFESEVIQSQQAICLVYYRKDSSSCNAYLAQAERLVDRLNRETCRNVSSNNEDASVQKAWLKLCTINADENRNLASAFSVERAKLPVTYFIMQGTIIDKVTSHVPESRLEGILRKFLEHYQQQMNVDLIGNASPNCQSPLPAAAGADLLSGASTQYLQNRIMDALLGPERISLPQESEKLDGLRKTIQQAKKKAFDELQELRRELGVDVRRLSEGEMTLRYYRSSQYTAAAVLSAFEALFLARVHAAIGNIAAENIVFALNALQRDFAPLIGDATVRRVVSLCEVLLVRGELVLQQRRGQKKSEGNDDNNDSDEYCSRLLGWIDNLVDARVAPEKFPSDDVEAMFLMLKSILNLSRKQQKEQGINVESECDKEKKMRGFTKQKEENVNARRLRQVKTCLLGVLQLYHTDPKSQDARSKLSSLLY